MLQERLQLDVAIAGALALRIIVRDQLVSLLGGLSHHFLERGAHARGVCDSTGAIRLIGNVALFRYVEA